MTSSASKAGDILGSFWLDQKEEKMGVVGLNCFGESVR